MTMDTVARPYAVRAVMQTLDILELLEEPAIPMTLDKVASVTGLPKTSAFRYLATLEHRGYVTRTADGAYLPSRTSTSDRGYDPPLLVQWARPLLRRIPNRFGETVSLGVLHVTRTAYLVTAKAPRAERIRSGAPAMLHCTALGKALAATLPEERVRDILASTGTPRFTKRTITDPDQFLDALTPVRRAGYAVNDGENDDGVRCVAVALTTSSVPLAVTLGAPQTRLPRSRVQQVVTALRRFDSVFGSMGGAA